jgi:aldose 1-epimerase
MPMSSHDKAGSRTPYRSANPVVRLASGPIEIELHPALGARIGRLRYLGEAEPFDYLAPLEVANFNPSSWPKAGCFTMLPYTNKFHGNTLKWGNEVIRVASPDAPAFLHGWGLRQAWSVVEASSTHCTMALCAAATDAWPWAYRSELRVSVDAAGMDLALAVFNESARPMPVGMGFHPYFSIDSGIEATVSASARWQADATSAGLPAVREALDMPLRLSLQNGALPEDTLTWFCETPRAEAVIRYPNSGRRISLSCSEAQYLVVHYRAGERFLCLEPCTHQAGGLDTLTHAALPGQSVSLSMRLHLA